MPEWAERDLLPVSLDLAHRADLRLFRVLAELPPGTPLPQQIPALVERRFGGRQLIPLVVAGQLPCRELGAQLMLGLDEIADVAQDLLVIHAVHRTRLTKDGATRRPVPHGADRVEPPGVARKLRP
jgi:hypothetical protein